MNTGHDGSLTTLHANSPEDVIDRMITMVRYAVDLPVDAIEAQIGNAFDYVVQVARGEDGKRYLTVIAEVVYDRKKRECHIQRMYERPLFSDAGKWIRSPSIIKELKDFGSIFGVDAKEVEEWETSVFG